MRPRVVPLVLLVSLAGCGARTALRADESFPPDARAKPDVVALDAPPVDTRGAPPPACAWTATPPVALTAGDRDRSPSAVRELDDRLWVGYQSSNPDPLGNQGRFVRVTDALGAPVAPGVEVLPSPAPMTGYGPLSLWTNPVTREHAAMAWTEGRGCQAVRLDDATRPVGATVQLDRARLPTEDFQCSSVVRHIDGWTYLSGGSVVGVRDNRLHAVTPDGVEAASVPLTPDDPVVRATARLVSDDGSFLYAWIATSTSGTNTRILLQRFDLLGRPVSRPTALLPARPSRFIRGLRLAADGAAALVGWTEDAVGVGAELVVARTDLDGAALVAAVTVGRAPSPTDRPMEFGLAVAGRVPGVLWNPTAGGDGGALRLTTLDPATLRPRGTAVEVVTARFPRNVFLRGTSQGFVAVFGAIAPPTLTQVWSVAFRCVAPG